MIQLPRLVCLASVRTTVPARRDDRSLIVAREAIRLDNFRRTVLVLSFRKTNTRMNELAVDVFKDRMSDVFINTNNNELSLLVEIVIIEVVKGLSKVMRVDVEFELKDAVPGAIVCFFTNNQMLIHFRRKDDCFMGVVFSQTTNGPATEPIFRYPLEPNLVQQSYVLAEEHGWINTTLMSIVEVRVVIVSLFDACCNCDDIKNETKGRAVDFSASSTAVETVSLSRLIETKRSLVASIFRLFVLRKDHPRYVVVCLYLIFI